MGTRRTSLPGVGTQYDFTTEAGRHISVVVHNDGRRFLGFYDPTPTRVSSPYRCRPRRPPPSHI